MKACYLSNFKTIEIREFNIPDFDKTSVLVKVKAAGICGSDFHAFHGSHPFRKPPMILGHEATGEIVKVGSEVKTLQIGDRITVEPVKTCGRCSFCMSGNYNVCPDKIMAGVRGWFGTFAEYFVVEEQRAHKLPPNIEYDMGVLVEPLAVGAHAVRLANIQKGMVCAVLGTGTIGLLAGIAAKYAGADDVLCTDINSFRLKIAKEVGLLPIKADEDSVEDTVKSVAPDGPDIIILALSSPSVLDQAIKLVKRGGQIVIIGVFNQPIMIDMNTIQINEINLKGSNIYTSEDFKTALNILVNKTADLKKILTHYVKFEEVGDALEMLSNPDNTAIKIIVKPEN